ncbi:hypothetical protein PIB30_065896 [Stylosanthes scabra]|uniref:Uncharacterized protein n=1 Tax=Stylosanthes scabra TaxID=79078 RepID=A0ABU6YPR5_9FABA|nr:hypothetical protein [Stylosanthes scabra]
MENIHAHPIEGAIVDVEQGNQDGFIEDNLNFVAKVISSRELSVKTIKAALMGIWVNQREISRSFFLLLVALSATASSVHLCRSFIISSYIFFLPSSNNPSLPYPFTEIRSFSVFPSEIDICPSLAALFSSAMSLSPSSSASDSAPCRLHHSQAATTTDNYYLDDTKKMRRSRALRS